MSKPRLLDLYCCAGGATKGYQQAGFHVTGVDINPQPDYPGDVFVQADALEYLVDHGAEYDAIHASPPCQDYSIGSRRWREGRDYPDLLPVTRDRLVALGKPYVIENVSHADMNTVIVLCGTMFGLKVIRHRKFESNILLFSPGPCRHVGTVKHEKAYVTVAGHGGHGSNSFPVWKDAMQIDWITDKHKLAQAIPPVYTNYIGIQLMRLFE